MTTKDKIILILISIITFGIYPIVIFRKKEQKTNEKLSSKASNIDYKKLKKLLGEDKNIVGCEYTHSKIKFFVNDIKNVMQNEIKKIKGISGIIITSKTVTIIVGNQAKSLANNFN